MKVGRNPTHGMRNTPEYECWRSMKKRCLTKTNPKYNGWGGKGITICKRWEKSFENFYEDMGKRPSSMFSLDRIDNNGNYEPGNCRWATKIQQQRNRNNCVIVEYNGLKMSLTEWAEYFSVTKYSIYHHLNVMGKSFEQMAIFYQSKNKK